MAGPVASANVACGLAVLSVVLFVLNGEMLQFMQSGGGHTVSPLVNIWACHLAGLALLPWAGPGWKKLSSLMQPDWLVTSVVVLSVLLMCYNYFWVLSSREMPVAMVNAVFQSSVGTTYLFSVVFLNNSRFSQTKTAAVILAIIGAYLACASKDDPEHPGSRHSGLLLAGLAVIGNTAYQIAFKRWFGQVAGTDASVAIVYLVGVSAVHLVFITPLLGLAHLTGFETAVLPQVGRNLAGVLLTAVIAFFVNGLWILVLMLGSPVVLSCAFGLAIPLSLGFDMCFHHVQINFEQVLGHLMVIGAFALLTAFPDTAVKHGKDAADLDA